MKTFTDFKTFNEYFGTNAPLDNDVDVSDYGNKFRKQSEAVAIDFYRISLKQSLHLPEGHYLHYLNDQKPSALFFSSPKDVNSWSLEKRFTGYYVQFSQKIINENKYLFQKLMEFGLHEPLFLAKEDEKEIEQIYKYMLRHHRENPKDYDIILSYSLVLFNFVERLYLKQLSQSTTQFNAIVVRFQELLNTYYKKSSKNKQNFGIPTVQYFAKQLGVSSNYLGDVIKKHTGQSPLEQIHQFIIKQAKLKLNETNTPIKDISEELGFEYPAYFARLFKKETGITPNNYRDK